MKKPIVFSVDFPIVPKGRPRKGRYGFYTPSRTLNCEKAIKIAAGRCKPFAGPVRLLLLLARTRGDIDNRAKTVLDALNGIAYKDDSQVKELHVKETERGVSVITIQEL